MKKIFTLVLMSALAACGGSDTEVNEPTTGDNTAAVEAPAAMLAAAEMKIFFKDKEGIRIHADGAIEVLMGESWQAAGSIKNDAWEKDGEVGLRVGQDGVVNFVKADSAPPETVKFDGAALIIKGKTIAIGDDGTMTGTNGAPGAVRVEGATTDATKRTALLVMAGMMMAGKQVETAPAQEEPGNTPPSSVPPVKK